MERCMEAEWLDELPADHPAALGSRRDLRLLNFLMGNAGIVAQALVSVSGEMQATRIIELGAGDGHFMLQVAQRLGDSWKNKRALLVDRQSVISNETAAAFAA